MLHRVIVEEFNTRVCCDHCNEIYRVAFNCPLCGKENDPALFNLDEGYGTYVEILYCSHCEAEFVKTNGFNEDYDQYWECQRTDRS